jgi:Ran-interacting Mog1 protein
VRSTSVLPNDRGDRTPSAILLSGEQLVKKFNRSELDTVQVYMALYRVEDKAIDVVVTFNAPTQTEDGGSVGGEQLLAIERDFDTFIRSFQIKDFGLFA